MVRLDARQKRGSTAPHVFGHNGGHQGFYKEHIMSKDQPISLSEFIWQVKKDLLDRQLSKDDPVPLFAIDEIEVEVSVTASREAEGSAGLNLTILGVGLEAGGTGTVGKENAQTVRIKMTPLLSKAELYERLPDHIKAEIGRKSQTTVLRGDKMNTPDSA
jgi:hypothetical protein